MRRSAAADGVGHRRRACSHPLAKPNTPMLNIVMKVWLRSFALRVRHSWVICGTSMYVRMAPAERRCGLGWRRLAAVAAARQRRDSCRVLACAHLSPPTMPKAFTTPELTMAASWEGGASARAKSACRCLRRCAGGNATHCRVGCTHEQAGRLRAGPSAVLCCTSGGGRQHQPSWLSVCYSAHSLHCTHNNNSFRQQTRARRPGNANAQNN